MPKRTSHAVVAFLLSFASILGCHMNPHSSSPNESVVAQALETLRQKGVSESSDAVLLLKRLESYLDQVRQGNAYLDWKPNRTSPVYNATTFVRLMDRTLIDRIVVNGINGNDVFLGIDGWLERAYRSEVDGSIDSYLVYVPKSYSPNRSLPLVVVLHGWGDAAYINPTSAAHFDLLRACERRGVVLVAPNGRHRLPASSGQYVSDAERDVLQVVDLVRKAYGIDDKRIYLTGASMGGFGTFSIASRHAELFAAIAPVCGYWDGRFAGAYVDLSALAKIPVRLYHADADSSVPVSQSRSAFAELEKLGANVEYREIRTDPNDAWDVGRFGGHNAWDYAYADGELIDWFLKWTK